MALILSIETSTTVCSVALTDDKRVLGKEILFTEQSHSTHLTLLIEQLLKKGEKKIREIDAIAVSEGPGSYTGLRIGISTAKALCFTLAIPLISISTLKAMALQVIEEHTVASDALLVPMLDARRMEVYTASFDAQLDEIAPVRALILQEDSFIETLNTHDVFFFGDGSEKFRPLVSNESAIFLESVVPEAWAIGILASEKFQNEQFEDVAYFEPNYLKAYQVTVPKKRL